MPADLRQYVVHARTLAYRRREDATRRELERAAARGRVSVSTSWGKDSVALCDLACEVLGRPTLLHLAHPYPLPGAEHVVEHFAARAAVVTLPPARTLAEYIAWLRGVGLGYERADQAHGKRAKADRAREWCVAQRVAVQVLGMRAEESKGRRTGFRARGLLHRYVDDGLWVSNPLGWWTVQDVWARIASRGLPYPRLYDCETHGYTRERLRNTGWLTTVDAGEGRIAWLRTHFPAQWRALAAEFPQVARLT